MTGAGDVARLRAAIPALGRNVAPETAVAVRALYKPLLANLGEGVTSRLDVAYGADPRQALDLYGSGGADRAPILLYVPGGGFVSGDKRGDETFHGNVGRWAAGAGLVGVVMNYRLAPDTQWPGAAQDIAAACDWLRAHATGFGGNPDRIILFGHSAGATHVASFLFDPELAAAAPVRAAWLSSGQYAFSPDEIRPNVLSYFGQQPGLLARRSPLAHVAGSRTPVGVSVAEYDPPAFVAAGFDIAKAICLRDGACPAFATLEGHNHFSSSSSLGSRDDSFAARLLRFVRVHAA